VYLSIDAVSYRRYKLAVLLSEELFQIFESIDCAVKINFFYEIVCQFYLVDLSLVLVHRLLALFFTFFVNYNHLHIGHLRLYGWE
jgi:hypothetical protein